jgi:hypothetical protein
MLRYILSGYLIEPVKVLVVVDEVQPDGSVDQLHHLTLNAAQLGH